MTTSKDLLEEFVYFILGRGTEKEVPGEADHKLRQRLIARCDHLSDEVSVQGGRVHSFNKRLHILFLALAG